MTWKENVIAEQYGGDVQRFEAEFADAVTEGRLHAIHWNDLLTDAITLPDLKETARGFIEINLGYLPRPHVMLPYEPYLRALIQLYWQNGIAEDDFLQQAEDHIKLIRNADMKHNLCQTYDDAIYHNYRENFAPYGYAVRERLTNFLGYEPQLEHSLIAELWLRDVLSDDTYKIPDEMTPEDIRALTLIKYREVLLREDKRAADASPLLADSVIPPD